MPVLHGEGVGGELCHGRTHHCSQAARYLPTFQPKLFQALSTLSTTMLLELLCRGFVSVGIQRFDALQIRIKVKRGGWAIKLVLLRFFLKRFGTTYFVNTVQYGCKKSSSIYGARTVGTVCKCPRTRCGRYLRVTLVLKAVKSDLDLELDPHLV